MEGKRIITVLEEQDEFPHEPDDVTNYNESMYLNTFDLDQEIGGWFRLGNRVNEGYAEMTVCLLYTSPSPRDRVLSRMPSSA